MEQLDILPSSLGQTITSYNFKVRYSANWMLKLVHVSLLVAANLNH